MFIPSLFPRWPAKSRHRENKTPKNYFRISGLIQEALMLSASRLLGLIATRKSAGTYALETAESKALKALRLQREVSLQKLADLMGLSKPMVHQMEIGRANISPEYIKKCLVALDFNWADVESLLGKRR